MSCVGAHEEMFQANVPGQELYPAHTHPVETLQSKQCSVLGVSEHIVPLA